MQQPRFNIFNQIHKGLRALLYQTALHIQQTDFTNSDEADQTLAEVEQVVSLFHDHAGNEDSFVLPAVARFNKQIIASFESEHQEDERLSKVLLATISAWRETDNEACKAALGQMLFYHFNAFVAFNLYHMNKEETILNRALWEHYSDAEIICLMQAIIAAVPPEITEIETRWMFRGLNNPEITTWLQQVKNEAPSFVFQMHTDMAEEELPANRWNIINASLADAVMVS